ncbi:glycosyltransferase family 4 protein [Pseudanabaena sp. FACHB-1998]|uniref:glycosyltransferase family 4 protein n=1 Tax=Pseudanabaena sp. FACHB-1998 TaxID=2692858 RepID=UPI0016814F91|nr:glycosyltransferase family 4 protein [Pseudanabaena sp. FACHB-1998]MBD2178198.1 glycosyltransferase family 4 protein [Pseudanabaena sp. FACHB-1998]
MNKIWHCAAYLAFSGGGVKSYIDGLISSLPDMYASDLITSFDSVDQTTYVLLHVHEGELLDKLCNQCPAVYTLHNHHPYCPSGSKYLPLQGKGCDRIMSKLGCTWGHIVDGCGSRRLKQISYDFRRAYTALEAIQRLGITVIANSDYVRSQLIFNGVSPEQVVTLRCGIMTPLSKHEPLTEEVHGQQHILFAGRIVPEKGLDWLLKSMMKVNPSIHLDVAGDGWDLERVQNLAKRLKLEHRVTWHGWCDGERLEELYRQSFAVVFPSVWPEPAGLITLEAYARYRPIITSAVGGIPEHVRDRETGILVKPNHIKGLADAINDLSTNFEKARTLGLQGNAWFHEEFTLAVHASRLQKIYDREIARFNKTQKR